MLSIVTSLMLTLGGCDRTPASTVPKRTLVDSAPIISIYEPTGLTRLARGALLGRRDLQTVSVERDVGYHRTASYRAIPLKNLVDGSAGDFLEAKARDGFAAEIPLKLIRREGSAGPRAYLAVEDPARPWDRLPGKAQSAGPFYIVWAGADLQGISSEYWPYQLVSLRVKAAPNSASPERDLFVANCAPCHQLDGAGAGHIGPDLNRPMNPTDYFQRRALHRYIRDPASVRNWPGRQMPAFAADHLSDADIEAIINYLSSVSHPNIQKP